MKEIINSINKMSKSALNNYLICQRKYYYSLQDYPKVFNPILQYGIDFHQLLADINTCFLNKIKPESIKDIKFDVANKYLTEVIPTLKRKGYNVIIKREFWVSNNNNFRGIIDAIYTDYNFYRYLLLDYKTTEILKPFISERYEIELMIYLYLITHTLDIKDTKFELGILRFGKKYNEWDLNIIKFDSLKQNEIIDKINKNIKQINNSKNKIDYKKLSNNCNNIMCNYCDFCSICNDDE